MPMAYVRPTSVLVSCSGCVPCLLLSLSFVFRKFIVHLAECDSWFRSPGFLSVVSPGSVKSCGCIVLFRPSLSLVQSWADKEGHFLQCEFSYHDQSFRVVSLYAPNRNPARNEFLEQIADELDPSVPTLLCGDFNTVFDRSVDRRGSDSADTWRESSVALKALFESCCVGPSRMTLCPHVLI